jgi:hypothetical protein
MTVDWFVGREIVTAMSILIASWPFGIALALVGFVPLAAAHGWPAVMHVGAAAALANLVLIAVAYRSPPGAAENEIAKLELNLTGREWLLVSLAGAAWGTFNVGYIGLVSFAPGLFAARGYSLGDASRLVSVVGWVMIVSIPLSGYLAEASPGRTPSRPQVSRSRRCPWPSFRPASRRSPCSARSRWSSGCRPARSWRCRPRRCGRRAARPGWASSTRGITPPWRRCRALPAWRATSPAVRPRRCCSRPP